MKLRNSRKGGKQAFAVRQCQKLNFIGFPLLMFMLINPFWHSTHATDVSNDGKEHEWSEKNQYAECAKNIFSLSRRKLSHDVIPIHGRSNMNENHMVASFVCVGEAPSRSILHNRFSFCAETRLKAFPLSIHLF